MKYIFSIFILAVCFLSSSSMILGQDTSDHEEDENLFENFVYSDHNKKDPFWTLVDGSGNLVHYDSDMMLSDILIEGVFLNPNAKSLVIINGEVFKEKSSIGTFKIEKVLSKYVILSKSGKYYKLPVETND